MEVKIASVAYGDIVDKTYQIKRIYIKLGDGQEFELIDNNGKLQIYNVSTLHGLVAVPVASNTIKVICVPSEVVG